MPITSTCGALSSRGFGQFLFSGTAPLTDGTAAYFPQLSTSISIYTFSTDIITTGGTLTNAPSYGAASSNSTIAVVAVGGPSNITNIYTFSTNTVASGTVLTFNLYQSGAAAGNSTEAIFSRGNATTTTDKYTYSGNVVASATALSNILKYGAACGTAYEAIFANGGATASTTTNKYIYAGDTTASATNLSTALIYGSASASYWVGMFYTNNSSTSGVINKYLFTNDTITSNNQSGLGYTADSYSQAGNSIEAVITQTKKYSYISDATSASTSINITGADAAFSNGISYVTILPNSDPYYSLVQMLCHFDGSNGSTTFTDQIGNILTSHGTVSISTAQSEFGGASLYTNNIGYLSAPYTTSFNFGTNNFTIECWVYQTATTSGNQGIFCIETIGSTTGGSIAVYTANGILNANSISTSSTVIGNIAGSSAISLNTWHHVAYVNNGTSFTLYLDGVSLGTATVSSGLKIGTANITIGNDASGTLYWNGYIDELRISNGVARYYSQFTVPTVQFYSSDGSSDATIGLFALGNTTSTTNKFIYTTNTLATGTSLLGNVQQGSAAGNSTEGIFASSTSGILTTTKYKYVLDTMTSGTSFTNSPYQGLGIGNATVGLFSNPTVSNTTTTLYTYSGDTVSAGTSFTSAVSLANCAIGISTYALIPQNTSSSSTLQYTYNNNTIAAGASLAGATVYNATSTTSHLIGMVTDGAAMSFTTFSSGTSAVIASSSGPSGAGVSGGNNLTGVYCAAGSTAALRLVYYAAQLNVSSGTPPTGTQSDGAALSNGIAGVNR